MRELSHGMLTLGWRSPSPTTALSLSLCLPLSGPIFYAFLVFAWKMTVLMHSAGILNYFMYTALHISDIINIFARQPPNVIPTKRSFPLTFSTVKESKGSGNGNKPIALSDSSRTIDYPSPPAALKLNVRGNIWWHYSYSCS